MEIISLLKPQIIGITCTYDDSTGTSTCAYVINTGATFPVDTSGENDMTDGLGHGTHTAGTIGSETYDIAKNTKLSTITVLNQNGGGTVSTIIGGRFNNRNRNCYKGSVVNVSLGGPRSKGIIDAILGVVQSGFFVSVAAANEGAGVEDVSPASESSICTVAAKMMNDTMPEWSNFGVGFDVLAPGARVLSTWSNGSVATALGTSMAAPHVARLEAYLLGVDLAEVKTLCETIHELALKGVVSGVRDDTANLLAHNGVAGP